MRRLRPHLHLPTPVELPSVEGTAEGRRRAYREGARDLASALARQCSAHGCHPEGGGQRGVGRGGGWARTAARAPKTQPRRLGCGLRVRTDRFGRAIAVLLGLSGGCRALATAPICGEDSCEKRRARVGILRCPKASVLAVAKRAARNLWHVSGSLEVGSAARDRHNVFVCRSRRSAEREAVGLALMRQQVNAGSLKVTWMSEEEKAAYRLREPADAGADRGGSYDSEPRPATRRAPRGDQAAGMPRLASGRSPRVTSCRFRRKSRCCPFVGPFGQEARPLTVPP